MEGNCPSEDITGHGPISFNDFSAGNQYSVTKFVNEHFGESVQAVQIEVSDFYRCHEDRELTNMVKFMRSLKGIVTRANTYYSENRSNSNKDSNNLKQGYKNA